MRRKMQYKMNFLYITFHQGLKHQMLNVKPKKCNVIIEMIDVESDKDKNWIKEKKMEMQTIFILWIFIENKRLL